MFPSSIEVCRTMQISRGFRELEYLKITFKMEGHRAVLNFSSLRGLKLWLRREVKPTNDQSSRSTFKEDVRPELKISLLFYFLQDVTFLMNKSMSERSNVMKTVSNKHPPAFLALLTEKKHEENAFFRSQSPKVRVIRRHGQQRGLSEDVSTSLMQRPANWAQPSHYPLSGDLNEGKSPK